MPAAAVPEDLLADLASAARLGEAFELRELEAVELKGVGQVRPVEIAEPTA